MNELSLFTGAGGGVLGSKILGWKTIGYVEYEPYCQEILKQRIADGILDAAPIFGDIKRFLSEGYAEKYQGMVDIVTGGFPCQPFSVAGKRAGENDPRNMWPSTIECIRTIRPRFAFLENVPGLLTDKYMGRIFGDLAESGYSIRWTCLGADDIGANHRRKRLWILAYTDLHGSHKFKLRVNDENAGKVAARPNEIGELREAGSMDNAIGGRCKTVNNNTPGENAGKRVSAATSSILADSRLFGQAKHEKQTAGIEQRGQNILWNTNAWNGDKGAEQEMERRKKSKPQRSSCRSWWSTEPDVGRVAHGVASRVDRLKAIGNGQVPLCAAYAFRMLSQMVGGDE